VIVDVRQKIAANSLKLNGIVLVAPAGRRDRLFLYRKRTPATVLLKQQPVEA
jgi:hypothetical protein